MRIEVVSGASRRWRLTLSLLAALFVSCGAETVGSPATAPSTSLAVDATTTTMVSSAITTTTVGVTPTLPPTTTLPTIEIVGAPGERIDIGLPASLPNSVPAGLAVRMTPANGVDRVSGYVGTVRANGGELRLVGSIPAVLVRAGSGADSRGPVSTLPTPAGEYAVGLGFVVIKIRVTQDAPPHVPTISQAPPAPANRRLLGDADLAGVALQTPEAEATPRLIAVLGPPTETTPWRDTCTGQFRYLRWPALMVMFRRADPQSPGFFASYTHHASTEGLPPEEQRLATPSSITLGSTVAEVRGAAVNGVFIGTSLGGYPPYDGWYVPGTEQIVFFDRDFVDPEARVRAIASPRGAALADC